VPDRLPIPLVPNRSATAKLPVGEDVAANAPEGKTTHVCLRIRISAAAQRDQLEIALNGFGFGGVTPEGSLGATPAPAWFQLAPPLQNIRTGDNLLEIRFDTPRAGDAAILMDRLELTVSYQPSVAP
jgi:hypothetical protein